ncbi:hypothetical protein EON65_23555 [archaeon]|nr:MAG: hypothetical protein EON65_23555 [archaeon]
MRNSSIFSHINGIQLGDVYSTQSDGHLHPHPQLTSTPPFALTGACDTLPNTDEERFRNPCAKVVTYPFYIPIGSSKVAMELRARNSLNNSVLQAAGQTCASRMVRLTCGNIYRRCTNNVDFEDYATYNYQIYTDDVSISTVGLPFDRPCVSVCTEARLACGGTLYSFAAVLPNCTERLDYSRGSAPGGAALVRRYDPTNTQCYVPAIVTINAQVENFIPKNNMSSFCSGYASSMLIGAGPAVNDSYTVLQEPNTIQNAIVQRLQGLRNNLPPFLSSDCMAAAKKYFCYQTLLTPQRVTIRRALEYSNLPNVIAQLTSANSPLLTSFIYMPMLPPQNICLDYEDKCASFIESANSTNITPNCTGFVRNRPGVTAFPTMNQTFTTVTTTTGLLLKFPSYVNNDLYYNTSEMAEYTPTCPRGYVMPDDPDHEDVRWIGFSVCAVACK